ncbi:D-2-hydroxyacid dehydrogenase [Bacillus salipaludis]|uniref:D-2-hydroxyacid dehydrogenase n=1 Tax=Bacillus salipaludis TaxID=2547811 RepID=A0A4R5VWC3_9BACI|nr:D-2-hydroxyacid dehydrogenase [Bacillus salipaludis]MDQ6597197.1 D-2-hydroxyacid dehydrogenase [Bacillus salipaludis]TDK63357.1 D-2-hydroxyacid dehydrogenase [Bacillus salipaludis]
MNSSQPNILVFDPHHAEEYANCVRECGFKAVKAAATYEEAEMFLPGTEIILGWKFPTQLLHTPNALSVRWFQSMGAGVNDLVANSSIPDDILLTRIVDQFGTYISEYIFAYLLHIVKDIPRMRQAQTERNWDSFISDSLAKKTIGVAGLGSIGAETVRKAKAFDMKVHGLSFSGKNAEIVDQHFTANQWKDFVKDLDYLVLTLPLTEKTYHVINREILFSMKPDSCLVNVGRGALIAENDLQSVLEEGHLKAAILDVFETEPLPKDHRFYSMPNVYVTSHLSGPSTTEGVTQFFVDNVIKYLNGETLHGIVDRKRGY